MKLPFRLSRTTSKFISKNFGTYTALAQKYEETKSESRSSDDSETIKENILQASLPYVPNYGWTKDSISAGAKDCGYPGITNGLFQKGGADLVSYFISTCNEKLEQELKAFVLNNSNVNENTVVKTGIETKLQMIIPYINKWPQALALMLLPQNSPDGVKNLSTMVNTICFYAGYKELNTLWYARRLGVTTLYKTTELFLLQDKSIGYENTWLFLDKSIRRTEFAQDTVIQLEDADKVLTGAFITVKNMIGLNQM